MASEDIFIRNCGDNDVFRVVSRTAISNDCENILGISSSLVDVAVGEREKGGKDICFWCSLQQQFSASEMKILCILYELKWLRSTVALLLTLLVESDEESFLSNDRPRNLLAESNKKFLNKTLTNSI